MWRFVRNSANQQRPSYLACRKISNWIDKWKMVARSTTLLLTVWNLLISINSLRLPLQELFFHQTRILGDEILLHWLSITTMSSRLVVTVCLYVKVSLDPGSVVFSHLQRSMDALHFTCCTLPAWCMSSLGTTFLMELMDVSSWKQCGSYAGPHPCSGHAMQWLPILISKTEGGCWWTLLHRSSAGSLRWLTFLSLFLTFCWPAVKVGSAL